MSDHEQPQPYPPQFDYESFELPENVALNFRFSPHNTTHDLPPSSQLRRTLTSADAIVLELLTEGSMDEELNKIARGNTKVYQYFREHFQRAGSQYDGWFMGFVRELYDAKTPLMTIDLDCRNPLIHEFEEADISLQGLISRMDTVDVDKSRVALSRRFEAVKQRDQLLLQNFKPRIDALTLVNSKLAKRRNASSLSVPVFYGDGHWSLYDALRYKQEQEPVDGFDVTVDPDSTVNMNVNLYAHYLNGQELPEEKVLQSVAERLTTDVLVRRGFPWRDMPHQDFRRIAGNLIDGQDLTNLRSLRQHLSTADIATIESSTGSI
jgi:hypothetical protein